MSRSQCARLLTYLREHESINPLEAWTELGIYRLGTRIFELRRRDCEIRTERKYVLNRWNEKVGPVGFYFLDTAPDGIMDQLLSDPGEDNEEEPAGQAGVAPQPSGQPKMPRADTTTAKPALPDHLSEKDGQGLMFDPRRPGP
jgi:hypothetical protein